MKHASPMQLFLTDRTVDLAQGRVVGEGWETHLTELERALATWLIQRAPDPVSREELLEQVWRLSPHTGTRCVDSAVRRLRRKIEPDPSHPRYIVKIHGTGYRWTPARPAAPAPLPRARTNLPPAPTLVGREDTLQAVVAALCEAPVVTLVGPPGAGLTSLALAAARRAGGHFPSGAWQGDDDPGPGALWVRDAAPPNAAQATQLYTGAATDLPGEHVLLVPPLPAEDRVQLLPDHPELRERVGGLAGALWRIRERLARGEPAASLGSTPSRRPSDETLEALRPLGLLRGAWSLEAIADLTGHDPVPLLRSGWLQREGTRALLPSTVRHHLPAPTADDHRRHASWVLAQVLACSSDDLPGATPDALWPQARAALDWCAHHDGERFMLLHRALRDAVHTRVGPDQRSAWLSEVLAKAVDPKLKREVHILRAETHRLAGHLEEAFTDLDRADDLIDAGCEVLRGRSLVTRAATLLTAGQPEEAWRTYQEAATHLDGDPVAAVMARIEGARLQFRHGHDRDGLAQARRALQEARRSGNPQLVLYGETVLGRMLSDLGWHWEGIPRLRAAVDGFRRQNAPLRLISALCHLGTAQLDLGSHEAADENFREAQALCREHGYRIHEALAVAGRGLAHALAGRVAEARDHLQESVILYEDAGQPHRSWFPLWWLAWILHRLDQAEVAGRALDRCASLAGSRADRQGMIAMLEARLGGAPAGALPDPPPEARIDIDLRLACMAVRAG